MCKVPLNLAFEKAVSIGMVLLPFRKFTVMERFKNRKKKFAIVKNE